MSKPDKQSVRAAFERAAGTYDAAAVVQREVCRRLLAFADRYPVIGSARRVVDAGCGTGYALGLLRARFPDAEIIAMDFAPAMLLRMPATNAGCCIPLCADIEQLPLASRSVDVLWSSLMLQWCDSQRSLTEIARVLRPGGRAWLATLGPRTLWELSEAFSGIDDARHVIDFESVEQLAARATDAGLAVAGQEAETAFALAPDLGGLLRDIKAIGAHQVGSTRRHRLLGKGVWRTLADRYERHRRADGLLPATYDVSLLALVKPG